MSWLAGKTARVGRIEKIVHKTIRDDGFIVQKLKERRADDVVVILSLVPAYDTINSWRRLRTLREFVESTNTDVIAFELGAFGLYQAITEAGAADRASIQNMKDSGLSDEEIEGQFCEAEEHGAPLFDGTTAALNGAVIMLQKMFRLEYELEISEARSLWGGRVREYSGLESTVRERLALNLARLSGAKDFRDRLDADEVVGKTHIALMLEVTSYRRRIIPALIDSVQNLWSVS